VISKLFQFSQIGVTDDEVVFPQYVMYVTARRYLVFPLKEGKYLTRGIIVDMPDSYDIKITATEKPPI
jgi:hypothetical protein